VRILDDLASQGYESFFFDQRGSGWTSPDKAKGLTDEFHTFDDLDFFIKMNIDEIGPDMKLFMGGHSMGGGIALNYGITGQYKDRLSGIFVTGPLILLHPRTRPNRWLRSFSELVAKVWPTKKIDTELVKHYVTADEEWADFISENPILTPFIGTLRQISDFLKRYVLQMR
jgi:acylglycerol lipase